MSNSDLYKSLLSELTGKLHVLKDKPEETPESTLRALWLASAGINASAESSVNFRLPDLTGDQIKTLQHFIELRLNNKPLAHITHRQNFLGLDMISDQRALIPRKETEILGKKALDLSRKMSDSKEEITVLDVCCGSGNLGIALAYYDSSARVYAADISEEAVSLTRENIRFLNLGDRITAIQSDLLAGFEPDEFYGKTDLLICNPPYIQSSKVQKMDSEIASFEPDLAFDGGMLGIKIIQRLIKDAPDFLISGGWLAFEVGLGQGDFIGQLCQRSGAFGKIEQIPDESGNTRVICLQK